MELLVAERTNTDLEIDPLEAEISVLDKKWLAEAGCSWPDESSEKEWLAEMNVDFITGSQHMNHLPDEEKLLIIAARSRFLKRCTNLSYERIIADIGSNLAPTTTMAGMLRVLSGSKADIAKAFTTRPQLLKMGPALARDHVAVIDELGYNTSRLLTYNPGIIETSSEKVIATTVTLKKKGLDAVKIFDSQPFLLTKTTLHLISKVDDINGHGIGNAAINKYPGLLKVADADVTDRLQGLTNLGLNALGIANKFPNILGIKSNLIEQKMRILYSAARAWGWDDPMPQVNAIVNKYPIFIGSSAAKLRVLVRIASRTLPPISPKEALQIGTLSMLICNIESMLASYLLEKEAMNSRKAIRNIADRRKRKIGKQALLEIIRAHPNDSIVKVYLRSAKDSTRSSVDIQMASR